MKFLFNLHQAMPCHGKIHSLRTFSTSGHTYLCYYSVRFLQIRIKTVRSSLLLDFCRKKPDNIFLLLLDFGIQMLHMNMFTNLVLLLWQSTQQLLLWYSTHLQLFQILLMDYQRLQTMLLILRLRPKVSLQLNPISVIVEVNTFCLRSINYQIPFKNFSATST